MLECADLMDLSADLVEEQRMLWCAWLVFLLKRFVSAFGSGVLELSGVC